MKKNTLVDIRLAIFNSGITKCEDTNCKNCEFDKHSPESKEFGFNPNICVMLNEIYKTK